VMVKVHLEHPKVAQTHSNRYFCDRDLSPTSRSKNRQMPKDSSFLAQKNSFKLSHFKMLKRSFYDLIPTLPGNPPGIDPTLLKNVDKDLSLKLEEVAWPNAFLFVNELLYLYRKHPANLSQSYKRQPKSYKDKIMKMKNAMYAAASYRRKQLGIF